ncbi:hypothetical protein XENOCAPTIV_002260, partial [Xenoophorus captivus]
MLTKTIGSCVAHQLLTDMDPGTRTCSDEMGQQRQLSDNISLLTSCPETSCVFTEQQCVSAESLTRLYRGIPGPAGSRTCTRWDVRACIIFWFRSSCTQFLEHHQQNRDEPPHQQSCHRDNVLMLLSITSFCLMVLPLSSVSEQIIRAMSAGLEDTDSVFDHLKEQVSLPTETDKTCLLLSLIPDLNEAVPETELLDNSIQKGRAQLIFLLFTLMSQGRRSPEDEGASLVTPPRGRYHQLTNATSQEALVTPSSSPSKSCPSSDCSPVYMRRNRRPDSE